MKLGIASILLLAVAGLAGATQGGVRGLLNEDLYTINSWYENIGYCSGAVCGVWGDPHIITCDGLAYDCNAAGLFTVMKNFLYNIQGHFINVNSDDLFHVDIMSKKHARASIASDLVIENVENPDVPIFQFSFPEHIEQGEDGSYEPPGEHGCNAMYSLSKYLEGYSATTVASIRECRQHCLDTEGCYNFQFTYGSGSCRLAPHDATPTYIWGNTEARTVSGPVDKCGKDYAGRGDVHEFANWYGNGQQYKEKGVCPLLFYVNGELQDISDLTTPDDYFGDFLYGDEDSDVFVRFQQRNKIKISTKTNKGSISEILLEVGGEGPGELFGCHFNFFVCLPRDEKDDFASSVGLLGGPDMDPTNDWIANNGTVLSLPPPMTGTLVRGAVDALRGEAAFNYCLENWCVPQEECNYIPPSGASYDDIKCVHQDFVPIEEDNCIVSPAIIHDACDHHPPVLKAQCELECCMGECDLDEQFEEIKEIIPLVEESPNETVIVYDTIFETEPDVCDGDAYKLTSDEVCPDSGDIVQLLKANSDGPAPVIYGVEFVPSHDDTHGNEVSFHVGNPTDSNVKTYVRYEKNIGWFANDPACDKQVDVATGCQGSSNKITAGCIKYPGREPFALVNVYMASEDLVGDAEIIKCCDPDDDGFGVVKYAFKIQCACPDIA